MKIIIAGGGKVGLSLVRQLSSAGYDITLIDAKQSVLDKTIEKYDILTIRGNCASMNLLQQADIADTDLLIAATNEDEVNLLCCMTAQGLNPNLNTIARIRNPEYTEQVLLMRDTFSLSLTVNPEKQTAREIEHLIKYPGFLRRDRFAKGRVEIVELRLKKDSPLCDIPLISLNSIINCKVLVCIVLRGDKVIAPDGNFVLREGDRLYVTAPTATLTVMLKNLGIITHRVKRVIICGGSRISYYLASQLTQTGISVQLIEKDLERCEQLADLLPEVCILHGDASDESLLDSVGLEDCDALVTLTGLDEINIITSLYGNSHNVPLIVTKLGHMENSNIVESLSIGSVISPKELCCNTIVRYVRAMYNQTGAAISVHSIADGHAEAIEFLVDETTKHCNEPLKSIQLKSQILVGCIIHGPRTEIPDGESSFSPGDTVIIISTRDDVIYQLNDIFM